MKLLKILIVPALLCTLSSQTHAQLSFDANTFYVTTQGGGIYTVTEGVFNGLLVSTSGGLSPGVAFFGGNLYSADSSVGTVWKHDPDGTRTAYATGFDTSGWGGPSGLLFDAEGNLYVSEIGGGGIGTNTPSGSVWKVPLGGGDKSGGGFILIGGSGAFIGPTALTHGPNGTIYVAEWLGGRVSSVESDTSVVLIADALAQPVGVQVACDGTVYVSEHAARKVTQIPPSGPRSTLFPILFPEGQTYDDSGGRYVLEATERRIIRFDASGGTLIVATLPGTPASTDQMVWYGGGTGPFPAPHSDVCAPEAIPPTANAGSDQTIHAGDLVLLDGSLSFDDNTATLDLLFDWTFTSVPAGSSASIVGADTISPSFVADVTGTYNLSLIVTDEDVQASTPDLVIISSENLPPTADAGGGGGGRTHWSL